MLCFVRRPQAVSHTDSSRDREHNNELLVRCKVQLRHFDGTESRQRRESATVSGLHARRGNKWGKLSALSLDTVNKLPLATAGTGMLHSNLELLVSLPAVSLSNWRGKDKRC